MLRHRFFALHSVVDFCSPQKSDRIRNKAARKKIIGVSRSKGINQVLKIKVDNLALQWMRPEKIQFSSPLLFIHGAGGTSLSWKNYLPYFARQGWEVYAVNLRGHFPSDFEKTLAQVTIEDYLEDLAKIIRRLEIEHCCLIGHSLGGLLAQKIAENISNINALITIASAPPFGVAAEINKDLPYFGVMLETMWNVMNLEPIRPTFPLAEKTALCNIEPDKQKAIFKMFVPESLLVGCQVLQGYPVYPSNIKCPKLVIGCAKDVIAPPPMQKRLADFLQADYLEYEQYGHLPMLEKGWIKSGEDLQNWLKMKVANKRNNFLVERVQNEASR